ncbi:MAG: hypothetical protein L3J39_04160 [Verrucomicrobiales bacterium]|nr:hypothetical protein [Verrucomicrobiales bacterium]
MNLYRFNDGEDLISKMRSADFVHADETYWREGGGNKIIWYAGNEDVAVFKLYTFTTYDNML